MRDFLSLLYVFIFWSRVNQTHPESLPPVHCSIGTSKLSSHLLWSCGHIHGHDLYYFIQIKWCPGIDLKLKCFEQGFDQVLKGFLSSPSRYGFIVKISWCAGKTCLFHSTLVPLSSFLIFCEKWHIGGGRVVYLITINFLWDRCCWG